MRHRKTLDENQELLSNKIAAINLSLSARTANENELAWTKNKLSTLKKLFDTVVRKHPAKSADRFNDIDLFINELIEITISNDKNNREVNFSLLKYLVALIGKALKLIKKDDEQEENFEIINDYHEKMEHCIKKYFDPKFSLNRYLDLSTIRNEYNNAYNKNYGQGFIGFFKLPIKRFFRQSSREEELNFLSAIDSYCHRQSLLDQEFKNILKLSAVNLVSLKISAETYAKGSILNKLLENLVNESGLENDSKEIMTNFLTECGERKIKVPAHLKVIFQKHVDKLNDTVRPS